MHQCSPASAAENIHQAACKMQCMPTILEWSVRVYPLMSEVTFMHFNCHWAVPIVITIGYIIVTPKSPNLLTCQRQRVKEVTSVYCRGRCSSLAIYPTLTTTQSYLRSGQWTKMGLNVRLMCATVRLAGRQIGPWRISLKGAMSAVGRMSFRHLYVIVRAVGKVSRQRCNLWMPRCHDITWRRGVVPWYLGWTNHRLWLSELCAWERTDVKRNDW